MLAYFDCFSGISGDMTDLSSNLAKRRIEYVEQDYQSVIASARHDLFELGTYFSLSSHLDKDQRFVWQRGVKKRETASILRL